MDLMNLAIIYKKNASQNKLLRIKIRIRIKIN